MTETAQLTSRDGTRVHLCRWTAGPSAKASLLIVHGYCEHGQRYGEFAEALGARGIETWAVDLRGHGRSEGARGLIRRFDEYLDDVDAAMARMSQETDGRPCFVLGHSLGGLVTYTWAASRPQARDLRGIVLSNPFMGLAVHVPGWKRLLAHVVGSIHPGFSLPSGLDSAMLSHDAARNEAYREDPLIFQHATAGWFLEATRMHGELERLTTVPVPTLFLVGDEDAIARPASTRAVFDRLVAPDKTWTALAGNYHELLNEPWRADTYALIGDWIEQHSGVRSS